MRWGKKRWGYCIVVLVVISLFGNYCIVGAAAEPDTIRLGDKTADWNMTALTAAGYEFVDDRDTGIRYSWPYNIEGARQENGSAYGGTQTSNLGQVSASISYHFAGTYLAVAFAETYYAAKIIITIDGEIAGTVIPHNPEGTGDNALESRVVFVKDDLANTAHTVVITHEAAHTTGEDNRKPDGNAYYDNNAMFDCFVVKKYIPETLQPGDYTNTIADEFFTEGGYLRIDDRDTGIRYSWPYDLDIARQENAGAYGGTQTSNLGQVTGTISYDFKGTYLAVAFAETYYAAKIIITIDGEVVGTATPHNPAGTGDDALDSRIVFVKDDLPDTEHTVVITHEAAHTTGEDNRKPDGNAYYDNNAMFDCFILKKAEAEIPDTADRIAVWECCCAALVLGLFVFHKRRKENTL